MNKSLWILIVLFGFSAATLSAQATDNDKSKFGLIFSETGTAAGVGALWQLNSHIAFSPYFNFRHEWKGTPYGSNTLSVGAKLPLYLKNWNKMRLYVAPGYEFTRIRTQGRGISTTASPQPIYSDDDKSIFNEGSGVLGIQYAIGNRISIFGDMGVAYQDQGSSHSSVTTLSTWTGGSTSYTSSSRTRTYNVGLKNSIGVIFYLK
jgi:hypothetical protein